MTRTTKSDGDQARPAVATTDSQKARRERIVHAALELLQQREYDRIQIREIAEKADVALGTLYRYFPSKEQLFANVLLEWSESFETAVRKRGAGAGSDAERLKIVLRRTTGAFERYPNFFQLITVLEVINDPDVAGPFAEFSQRFELALTEALVDVCSDDAAVINMMALSQLSTLLRGWWLGRIPLESVYEQLDRSVDMIFTTPRPV